MNDKIQDQTGGMPGPSERNLSARLQNFVSEVKQKLGYLALFCFGFP